MSALVALLNDICVHVYTVSQSPALSCCKCSVTTEKIKMQGAKYGYVCPSLFLLIQIIGGKSLIGLIQEIICRLIGLNL